MIRNVASEEEIQASIDEIWQTLYDMSKEWQDQIYSLEDLLVHRDDPNRFRLHIHFLLRQIIT